MLPLIDAAADDVYASPLLRYAAAAFARLRCHAA